MAFCVGVLMGSIVSRSTGRAAIEVLAERRDSPDALAVALLAIIFQVQEQVDDASKDLLNYVLGAVPPINAPLSSSRPAGPTRSPRICG
jgi:hypothetical protein